MQQVQPQQLSMPQPVMQQAPMAAYQMQPPPQEQAYQQPMYHQQPVPGTYPPPAAPMQSAPQYQPPFEQPPFPTPEQALAAVGVLPPISEVLQDENGYAVNSHGQPYYDANQQPILATELAAQIEAASWIP
jgi:hypothetical protein